MYNNWSLLQKHLRFRQVTLFAGIFCVGLAWGQVVPMRPEVSRTPASYVPDDDVIVKPVNNELSFYQRYVESDNSADVVKSRNQLKVWNDNQAFADQYGMDSTLSGSSYFVPSADEKWEYFKDKYMRYLKRNAEQPLKDMPKNWYQDYRASNEVDTIDELEARFKSTTKTTSTGKALPDALQAKEVSVWKKTTFIFQPRVDQGLVIVGFKTPFAYARAWTGINGRTEINVQQTYDSIGLRMMFNYYTDTGKYFTSVDQRLMENVYARLTSTKNPGQADGDALTDETAMLLYAKTF